MHILHYAENVYHQFFAKTDEVDYFLREAVDNETKYAEAEIPKDVAYLNKMQFIFSAFVAALVSSWEIARLSIHLDNSINGRVKEYGLPSERALTRDFLEFKNFFDEADSENHYWFCFLKAVRNASAHDGSCAVNGGNVEIFKFQSDLHRFEWNRDKKTFDYLSMPSTKLGAVTSMLAMAYKLSPLFLRKLKCPEISAEISKEIAKFNVESSFAFVGIPAELREHCVNAMVEARKAISDRKVNGKISTWEGMYKARFVWNPEC
jgi:hypothetical protein